MSRNHPLPRQIRSSVSSCLAFSLLVFLLPSFQPAQAQQPERLLFIRGHFTDASMGLGDQTWQERLQAINGIAEEFYVRDSYGTITNFQSQYTPILVLPEPSTGYLGMANVHKLNDHMRSLATNAGFNLNQFDQIVLSYPGVLNQPFGGLGTAGTVWMPGQNPWGPGFTHELGHAFGVGHASAVEGGNATWPGQHREGRDGLHMMGSDDGRQVTTNIYMKHRMGFIGDEYVSTVNSDGVYRIHAYDTPTLPTDTAKKLAARFKVDGRDFWASYGPSLADTWADFNGEGWAKGIEVHEVTGAITRILDFTPGSQGEGNNEDYWDTRDGALQIGSTFLFPDTAFRIQPLQTGIDPDGRRWIDVQFASADWERPSHFPLARSSLPLPPAFGVITPKALRDPQFTKPTPSLRIKCASFSELTSNSSEKSAQY